MSDPYSEPEEVDEERLEDAERRYERDTERNMYGE